ncbi:MAG: biotin/lipoyl-binding protein [Bacteroidales bacterium]|nr:biotin/lipoyl-binding protein [Bacteroidales bacterium]MCF8328417.1 biotin/lipoyl-binding protein [Bacteroidales bacterium]
MKEFEFTINGNKYSVEIRNFESNVATVEVNGTPYEVEVHKELKQPKTPTLIRKEVKSQKSAESSQSRPADSGGGSSSGGFQVNAPLPGTILDIHVKPGDQIKKGQNLITMEAMKMENSVLAEKDGTVKEIKVSQGDSVLQDDLLIEME